MTHQVVLDVNILASAAAVAGSIPAELVDGAFSGRFENVTSQPMLVKLVDVLTRPYFIGKISDERREEVIRRTRESSLNVEPDATVRGIANDEEDDRVLGTAVAAGADYLVTGDLGLLAIGKFRAVVILTAREFLAILESG